MIADPHLPRALWPVGRVVKTHPSPDGLIRSADVQVKERVYTRPVARLVVLPAVPSGEEDNPACWLLFIVVQISYRHYPGCVASNVNTLYTHCNIINNNK